jgi:CelD/BcsL family acetyltransferase involved in cellulose biosynthesis
VTEISVTSLTDRASLLGDWRALFDRVADAAVFLSPEWIGAWLAGAPQGVELWLIKGSIGGEIVLLGVIGVRHSRRPPVIGPSEALLHEFGRPTLDQVYIEYNDFLMSGEAGETAREQALAAMLDAIAADEFVLRNVRPDLAVAAERLAAARGLAIRRLGVQPTFAADLSKVSASGGEYLSVCSASLRSQLKRSMRLYEERGPVTIRFARTTEERSDIWRSLIALHQASWGRRGEKGAFANPSFTAFHERLAHEAPERVDLAIIRAGDDVVGCLYNLTGGRRVYNYQSGFRFEQDNQLKPGMISHALAIQHYAEKGYRAYDFLAGDAQYKRRLADEGEPLTTLVLETRRGIRSRARRAIRSWRRALAPGAEKRRT